MKRMYGGGATWENGESADIKDELNDFVAKLAADTVTVEDCDKMIAVFEEIQRMPRRSASRRALRRCWSR